MKIADALFATLRSKLVASAMVPVVAGPLLPVLPAFSLGLLTVAELPASGLVAFGEIVTSRTNMLFPPDPMEFGLLQVMFGTVPVHVHPAVELALTLYAVTPAGNVSATVVVPEELDGPAFVTVILYWPLPPLVKVPTETLAIVKSKTASSGVGGTPIGPLSVVQVGHSSGLLTVTTLLPSGLGALAEIVTSRISMLFPPDVIGFELVQVTPGTDPKHAQPGVDEALIE
jgi:hypothetical protein